MAYNETSYSDKEVYDAVVYVMKNSFAWSRTEAKGVADLLLKRLHEGEEE